MLQEASQGSWKIFFHFMVSLFCIFRSFIAPSGGNNDALTSPLCNLLILAKQCVEDEDPTKAYPVDVMDFVFNELYNSLMGRHTVPYALYIMLLIKKTLPDVDFSGLPLEDHHFKKLYMQKSKTGGATGASGAPENIYIDRKSTRLNSSHRSLSRMPSSA